MKHYPSSYDLLVNLFDQHCSSDDGTTRPLILVTASVDKMVLKKPIQVDTDLEIVGAVTWVGRSSMEIQMEVTQSKRGIAEQIIV
jgi:acyl-coenzyme A thioesterase 9